MIKQIAMFLAGAAIGAIGSYIYLDTKYAKEYAEKEIEEAEALDKLFERRLKAMDEEKKSKEETKQATLDRIYDRVQERNEDKKAAQQEVVKHNYASEEAVKEETEKETSERPYIIKPEEFGTDDHDEIYWVFWADGFVSDEMSDEIIPSSEVQSQVCWDKFGRFGEYEDDAVYVRNDKLGFDVFIRRDDRNFAEVIGIPTGGSKDYLDY